MRIGIDARCIQAGGSTGVETVVWNVLPHLFRSEHSFVLFLNYWDEDPPGARALYALAKRHKNVQIVRWTEPNKLLHLSLLLSNRPCVDAIVGGVDVFWMPNPLFASFSPSCPVVQTIHDCSFVAMPELYSMRRRLWHRAVRPKLAVRRASSVVVPSQHTRNDLVDYFGVSATGVEVIPHGTPSGVWSRAAQDPDVLHAFCDRHGLQQGYILCVGSFENRKNVESVLWAYAELRRRSSVPRLVLAGSSGWGVSRIERLIRQLGLTDAVTLLCDFRDDDKPLLYRCAAMLVYPSLYEGFGLPLLEAMSFGIPIVAGSASSILETVGDAGLLVDVGRPSDIAVAIHELLASDSLRESLVVRGRRRARQYSWRTAAMQYLSIFERFDPTSTHS